MVDYNNAIKILDFDDNRVEKFLQLKFKESSKIIDEIKIKLNNNEKLKTITHKPIFLNILCDRFKDLQKLIFINEAVLFQILTVGWIQHDLQKPNPLITDKQERKIEINTRCSERLAVAEFSSKLPVTREHIRSLVQDEFKYESTDIEKEFDSYIKYARDSTFLTVESNNSFSFLLKPLREYFVASRMIREINFYDKSKKIDCLLLKNISPEIFDFIKSITEATWLIKPHFIQKHTKNKAYYFKD